MAKWVEVQMISYIREIDNIHNTIGQMVGELAACPPDTAYISRKLNQQMIKLERLRKRMFNYSQNA